MEEGMKRGRENKGGEERDNEREGGWEKGREREGGREEGRGREGRKDGSFEQVLLMYISMQSFLNEI